MKVKYWLQDKHEQNFGDALTRFFLEEVFLCASVDASAYRIIGSAIADFIVEDDLGPINPDNKTAYIVFWGAGLRDANSLSAHSKARCHFASVRGPLTHAQLELDPSVPIGDPALLLKAIYQPSPFNRLGSRTICIPHFNDRRRDQELLWVSGAQGVVRPNIGPGIPSVKKIIDEIYTADFVLSASLHGAIVAASYGKPFCFWNPDYIDLPFKWHDFAASIGIEPLFARTISEGQHLYFSRIQPFIQLPKLLPILLAAPFAARTDVFFKLFSSDNPDIIDESRLRKILEVIGEQKQNSSFSQYYEKLDITLCSDMHVKLAHDIVYPLQTRELTQSQRKSTANYGIHNPKPFESDVNDILKSLTSERDALRGRMESLKLKVSQ